MEILVSVLNKIRTLILTYYQHFNEENKLKAREIYLNQLDKFKLILQKHDIDQNISNDYNTKIVLNLEELFPQPETESDNSDQLSESDTSESEKTHKMVVTVAEFLGNASKLLPEFDGKSENLQSFLDGIALVELIKGDHEDAAVNLVKTKLKGTSRNLITTESTLQQIVTRLKSSVKGESVEVLTAKILNIKQLGKAANAYTKEIEDLTKSLQNAYINDGISAELSEKYSTQIAVKAMTKNCNNDRVKLVMEAGSFNNMNEAVSKFVASSTEATGLQNSILFTSKRNINYNKRGNVYNNRGYSRGRGGYNNRNSHYNNQQGRNSNFQRGRGSHRGQNHTNNYSNTPNNRNIRLTASEPPPENE